MDRNMSEAISSLNDPTKIKLMFIREGEGVYQFGSKKIYVKIEQDKIYSIIWFLKKNNFLSSCWRRLLKC